MRYTLTSLDPLDGEAVLTVAAAKEHLRVDADVFDDDDLIAALRDAAVDWVERYTGCGLTPRGFAWRGTPCTGEAVALPVRPLAASPVPVAAFIDGAGGASIPVALSPVLASGRLIPASGVSWPSSGAAGAVTITFTAGFASVASEAPALVAAVKLLLGDLFKLRESSLTGTIVSDVPFGVTRLCAPFRMVSI